MAVDKCGWKGSTGHLLAGMLDDNRNDAWGCRFPVQAKQLYSPMLMRLM